jgi:aminopeptidase N
MCAQHRPLLGPLLIGLAAACSAPASGPVDAGAQRDAGPEQQIRVRQDIVSTALRLDLAARQGLATLVVRPATGATEVVLETAQLAVSSVKVGDNASEVRAGDDGWLRVPIAPGADEVSIEIAYVFSARTLAQFDGWMPAQGVSFTWPYYCANLFPCDPSMDDGVTFSMEVVGVAAGKSAVYPRTTVSDGPAYLPAVAVGAFEKLELGKTAAGTSIVAWYDPSMVTRADAEQGTAHQRAVHDFFERTYGPYTFGPESGSVSVDWGSDSYGGMEFHPYSHVAKFDYGDPEVHAHETAHGWFGDGVRLACWEDFVLSEGTVTYMAARGLEKAGGPDVWPMYLAYLADTCSGADTNAVVLPTTCNEIDLLSSPIWSLATYMKGACFYEEVADAIGWDALDAVIAAFYRAHVGKTARMEEMIAAIEASAPAHAVEIARARREWLNTLECPADFAARCGTHAR